VDINATILGQAITFALLVIFTMKFVWPPLNKMMEDRAKKIADGLAAAEEGEKKLLAAKQLVVEELKQAHVRVAEIMLNAEKKK